MSSNGVTKKPEATTKKSTNKFKPNGVTLPELVKPVAKTPASATKTTLTTDENRFPTKIYDAFLKLSQFNPTTRFEGIRQICDFYNQNDPKQNRNHNDYILNRLVKGLASNRKCSRLGFSCTLTELFTRFECLTFTSVLEMANKHLKFKDTGKESLKNTLTKEEIRHMQIGLAFVYVAFIQSSRLDNIDETDKGQMELINTLVRIFLMNNTGWFLKFV